MRGLNRSEVRNAWRQLVWLTRATCQPEGGVCPGHALLDLRHRMRQGRAEDFSSHGLSAHQAASAFLTMLRAWCVSSGQRREMMARPLLVLAGTVEDLIDQAAMAEHDASPAYRQRTDIHG